MRFVVRANNSSLKALLSIVESNSNRTKRWQAFEDSGEIDRYRDFKAIKEWGASELSKSDFLAAGGLEQITREFSSVHGSGDLRLFRKCLERGKVFEKEPFSKKDLLSFHCFPNFVFFLLCGWLCSYLLEIYFLVPNYEPVTFEALKVDDFSFYKEYGVMEFRWQAYGGNKIAGVVVPSLTERMSWLLLLFFPTYAFAILAHRRSIKVLFSWYGIKRSVAVLLGLASFAIYASHTTENDLSNNAVKNAFKTREKDNEILAEIKYNCKKFGEENLVLRIFQSDKCAPGGCSDVGDFKRHLRSFDKVQNLDTYRFFTKSGGSIGQREFSNTLPFICIKNLGFAKALLEKYKREELSRYECARRGTIKEEWEGNMDRDSTIARYPEFKDALSKIPKRGIISTEVCKEWEGKSSELTRALLNGTYYP